MMLAATVPNGSDLSLGGDGEAHRPASFWALALGRSTPLLFLLGTISGALFYGDAVITPALSVLSAIEGLKVAAPGLDLYVVPLTVMILVALFAVQSRGTAQVAAFFGPVMVIWFVVIAVPAVYQIARVPSVLFALNPWHAIAFLADHGAIGLV